MTTMHNDGARIATARLLSLFCIFFLIACGLGYPVLNRYDPRQTPGLSDVRTYAALVTGTPIVDTEDIRFRRFRVLVPWLSRPFYLLARGRVASWDPVMFGLLVSDSLFVAATAVLVVIFGGILGRRGSGRSAASSISSIDSSADSSAVGLVGALLYLVNFAVPNIRLVGLVDAGEGFFLLTLLWSLSEFKLWALPVIAIMGGLTKESFIPFSIVLTSAWWLSIRSELRNSSNASLRVRNHFLPDAVWILISWMLSLATMIVLQRSITGQFVSPLQFGLTLHRSGGYEFASSLRDRNLWYIFLWLLPTALPKLKRLPKTWIIPVAVTCAMAFALDAYFGGAPGTVGRALFTIAGPVLSLSSALFLLRISR